MSRIYGGIHWQFDNAEGLKLGRTLGEYVYKNTLQPRPRLWGHVLSGTTGDYWTLNAGVVPNSLIPNRKSFVGIENPGFYAEFLHPNLAAAWTRFCLEFAPAIFDGSPCATRSRANACRLVF